MGQAENYRKRANALGPRLKRGRKGDLTAIAHKQKGLRDLADNEDWLDGKPGTGIYPEQEMKNAPARSLQ